MADMASRLQSNAQNITGATLRTTLTTAISSFVESKRAEQLSNCTIADYLNTYKKFLSFLGEDPPIQSIEADVIVKFLGSVAGVVSEKTALNYHVGLSSLWEYCLRSGMVNENVVRQVRPPKPQAPAIIPYAQTEMESILAAAKVDSHPFRDTAIVLFLLDTGIRASELCHLVLKDVSLYSRKVIVVAGKGNKTRHLPFSIRTGEVIGEYLQARQVDITRKNWTKPLFTGRAGNPLTRSGLCTMLNRLGEISQIPGVHPHRFRHTFSINFLRNGGSIYTLQAILGHTSLDMVKRYLAIAQVDIDRDHAKASPVMRWSL